MSARHWSDGWTRDHLIDEIEQLRVEIRELRGEERIAEKKAKQLGDAVWPEGERAMLRAEIERLRRDNAHIEAEIDRLRSRVYGPL